MTTGPGIAVVLPCRNARHLLWRSLASVAAQTLRPAQILILDRGSTDGLAEWLLAHWPGIELCTVPAAADDRLAVARLATMVAAPGIAVLQPGEHWRADHLASLAAATDGLLAKDALGEPAGIAAVRCRDASDLVSTEALGDALRSCLGAGDVTVVDLRAAARPIDLIGLLGLALSVGGSLRALTLAELTLPTIEESGRAPLLISHGAALDLQRGSDQLCIEQLIRAAQGRPVRVLLSSLVPTTPVMLSRLLDAIHGHPDLELWVCDAVSRRFATHLLGQGRVRLVSPPILGLADPLRHLGEHAPIDPDTLGTPATPTELAHRARDHASWWAGYEPEIVRRLGLALAGMVEVRRSLRGPVLQRAWLSALVGWAVARRDQTALTTTDPFLGMFAAMCGRSVRLSTTTAKATDLRATWQPTLAALQLDAA